LCESADLDAGCLVSMLQRPIVKAKKCVPGARRTMSEGVARSTVSHCEYILTEQTLPALAIVKMEVAGGAFGYSSGKRNTCTSLYSATVTSTYDRTRSIMILCRWSNATSAYYCLKIQSISH